MFHKVWIDYLLSGMVLNAKLIIIIKWYISCKIYKQKNDSIKVSKSETFLLSTYQQFLSILTNTWWWWWKSETFCWPINVFFNSYHDDESKWMSFRQERKHTLVKMRARTNKLKCQFYPLDLDLKLHQIRVPNLDKTFKLDNFGQNKFSR